MTTDSGEFIYIYITPLKSLNLVLISGANWMVTGALGQHVEEG